MTRQEAKQKAHETVLFKGRLGCFGESRDPQYLDALSAELYLWLREIAEEQALQMKAARLAEENAEDEAPKCQHTLGYCPDCVPFSRVFSEKVLPPLDEER